MAQRLVRAKRRSALPASPSACRPTMRCPSGSTAVLATVYLIFNEGYSAARAELADRGDPPRPDARRADAGRARGARPARADAAPGLAARRRAATGRPARRTGPLALEQRADRRGPAARCVPTSPGPYQLQAAIAACHTGEASDWPRIVAPLRRAAPPPPLAGRRAEPGGGGRDGRRAPRPGSRRSTGSTGSTATSTCHTARADLLRRLGRDDESRAAYERALELGPNEAGAAVHREPAQSGIARDGLDLEQRARERRAPRPRRACSPDAPRRRTPSAPG